MSAPLQTPRFVLFDYGETLAHEDDYRAQDGFDAILKYADPPTGLSGEELLRPFRETFHDLRRNAHAAGAEIPNRLRWRWLFETFDLHFSLPMDQLEEIYWDAAAPCVPTPGVEELLARMQASGVRTGVISNMGFAGTSLRRRIERLFPDHRFDPVLSSADYVLRKPNPRLFQLALKKAGFAPEETWFLGDNPQCDVARAHAAGIFPVYYDRDLGCAYHESLELDPRIPCLRIHDWSELYPFFPMN
ncbi:MAG: HAD family hydrolase [Eubacteriales bacterium]|nr:HAD family hydrolase [Eubacteriales bacterium]